MGKILAKLPRGEPQWESINNGKDVYEVTSDKTRSKYILYKKVDGGWERLMTAKTPLDFKEIVWN